VYGNRCEKIELRDHVTRRDDGPDRFEERGIADIAGGVGVPASGIEIAQRHRLQRGGGVQCRLEQRRVKALEASPESCDSLGTDRNQCAAPELSSN